MLGAVMNLASMIPQNMMMEEDRNQRQDVAWNMQWNAQDFNSAQAAQQRDWSTMMSNTQYQRTVQDLKAAGLNPMLAYHHGGAGTPQGASASSAAGGPPGGSSPTYAGSGNVAAEMQAASQIRVNDALAERTQAEKDKVIAETEDISERAKTHAVSIDQMRQNIRESSERIHRIIEETAHQAASAAQARQQTENLREQIPQIRATVKQLQALTTQTGALTGKTQEETNEIKQRVKANLPALQAALNDLEATARQLDMPRREQDRAAHDRFTGSLGALIRSLTGLGTYIK